MIFETDKMKDFILIPEARMKKLRYDKKSIGHLKDLLGVDLIFTKDAIEMESEDSLKLLRAKMVLKAFGRGFYFEDALLLCDESFELSIIEIKQFAGKSRERSMELRGRVIGTKGKTKDIIEKLTGTKIAVYGKTVSVIGKWDVVQDVNEAICLLLEGRKHGGVYRFLEEKMKSRTENGFD